MKPKRIRRRFIIFKIEGSLKDSQVDRIILECFLKFYGIKGIMDIMPTLAFYDKERSIGILEVKHDKVKQAKSCLILCSYVKSIGILILRVTGTLRKARAIASSLGY